MKNKEEAIVGSIAEEKKALIRATNNLTSEELQGLNTSEIALRFYYLIRNGETGASKDHQYFHQISILLDGFATQLINREKKSKTDF